MGLLSASLLCSLRALIVALNDEVAQVRATAIASIGRVSARNPAYAMPALRRHLMQLLGDMNQAPETRQREGMYPGVGRLCAARCVPACSSDLPAELWHSPSLAQCGCQCATCCVSMQLETCHKPLHAAR